MLGPWPIPITNKSHYPGFQDTDNWTEKYIFHNLLVLLAWYNNNIHDLYNLPI